jgi:hypothetical protein
MKTPPGHTPDLRELLRVELQRRRAVNRRYSLRAFADWLGVDHSTLSQFLRGMRPAPDDALRAWAARLGMGREETEMYVAFTSCDPAAFAAQARRVQWLGEATAIVSNPAHWKLLELVREPDFRPDMRWAARRLGLDVDDLNDALSRLLRLGMLDVGADGAWRDTSGLAQLSEGAVKECALARARSQLPA